MLTPEVRSGVVLRKSMDTHLQHNILRGSSMIPAAKSVYLSLCLWRQSQHLPSYTLYSLCI